MAHNLRSRSQKNNREWKINSETEDEGKFSLIYKQKPVFHHLQLMLISRNYESENQADFIKIFVQLSQIYISSL